MRIKYSKFKDAPTECPQQKLKSISCTEELMRHRPLLPISPDRNKKDVWIMEPWENTVDQLCKSPEEQRVLNKHIDNMSSKRFRSKKGDSSLERGYENSIYCTPQSVKNDLTCVQKENKYRLRLYSQVKVQKQANAEENQQTTIFKKPITSIIYPMIRDRMKDKNRRIDKFHSFVARNIRK